MHCTVFSYFLHTKVKIKSITICEIILNLFYNVVFEKRFITAKEICEYLVHIKGFEKFNDQDAETVDQKM